MALYSVNAMRMYVVVVVNRTEMTLLVLRICKVQCIKHMHECDERNIKNTEGNSWAIGSVDVITKNDSGAFDVFVETIRR